MVRRSTHPENHRLTAFLIACGACWYYVNDIIDTQRHHPDNALLTQTMLQHGADINAMEKYGRTPLFWAAFCHRADTAALLIQHRANVNATDVNGLSPLGVAIRYDGSLQTVCLLLQHGANVNATDEQGVTPLMWAIIYDDSPDIIRLLLLRGAKVNLKDDQGWTAIYWAVDVGANQRNVLQLLAHGANPNDDGDTGTPLYMAQQKHRPDIVALLKHYGAKK